MNPRALSLRPIHGPDVERGVFVESCESFAREFDPQCCGNDGFQEEFRCGFINARAMEFKIGRDPFKIPRAIEDH